MTKPLVLVHIDRSGNSSYLMSGDVRLVVVDERSPCDRVYDMTVQAPREALEAIIGEEMVGNRFEPRHAALAARIEASIDGRSHLAVVE